MRRCMDIYKYMVVCILTTFGVLFSYAETVSMKQAKAIAQNFFNEARHYVTPSVSYVYNGKDLTSQRLFTPFYVFNSPTGGFVIIAADNKAYPILGFSLDQKFDKSKISSNVRSLLKEYSHDIEMIRFDSRVPSDAIGDWTYYPELIYRIFNGDLPEYFYSLKVDDNNTWTVCRQSTEFDFSSGLPAEIVVPQTRAIDNIEIPEAPVVACNIAGHFALSLPTDIQRVIVYNISGAPVLQKTYKNTNVAHIDISSEPNGFYIALIIDRDGICHSAKIYR